MKKDSKVVNYIKESVGELKKVTWPKKDEVFSSTLIVVVVIIVISLILGVFDYGMGEIVRFLFKPSGAILLPFLTL